MGLTSNEWMLILLCVTLPALLLGLLHTQGVFRVMAFPEVIGLGAVTGAGSAVGAIWSRRRKNANTVLKGGA